MEDFVILMIQKRRKIDSRGDVDSEVRICLAGYEAENLVYGKYPEKCLMGSGSDIENAWDFSLRWLIDVGILNLIHIRII